MTALVDKIRRLEWLRGLLAEGDAATVAELAAEIGVSTRTLMRDLDALRDDGLLIETDRGRGGGVRLARGHAVGRVQFTAPEAATLLLGLALAEQMQSPFGQAHGRAARQKLAAVFARPERERISALRRRILVGAPASAKVLLSYRAGACRDADKIGRAFADQLMLEIAYADEARVQTERVVEPHFLYLNAPAWYLLAWDHLRGAVRVFRFDRIVTAKSLARNFRLRSAAVFLEAAEAGVEGV